MRALASSWGFVKLPVIIAVACGVGFLASAYLNFYQFQQAKQEQTQLQGQITDLTYQVKLDHSAGANTAAATVTPSPSTSPTASPSTTPTPSATPAVAGAASVSFAQFGVKITVTDPLTDLISTPIQSGGLIVAGFSTQSLATKYHGCTAANAALGMLVRRPKGQAAKSQDKFIKTLGNYSFYYVEPLSACATAADAHTAVTANTNALFTTALPTLSQ